MSPFHVILAKTYFINSIPSEIMDAATIDGAGEIRIFFQAGSAFGKANDSNNRFIFRYSLLE